ncbi:MAG: transposase [Lautropia sp.]
MARPARNVVAGYPYHLIARGNNRQATFVDDLDRHDYKAVLQSASTELGVAVHAYVLMTNHVHLIATPPDPTALGRLMQAVGRQYVRHFNRRHHRTGTLWEGRYRASIIQNDRYLLACQRYIEMNPVRAGLVAHPQDFRWSSHRHHLGVENDSLVSPHPLYWALGNTPFDREASYRALFDTIAPIDDPTLTQALLAGKPLADRCFLERLERATGLALEPRPVGRPRKVER